MNRHKRAVSMTYGEEVDATSAEHDTKMEMR